MGDGHHHRDTDGRDPVADLLERAQAPTEPRQEFSAHLRSDLLSDPARPDLAGVPRTDAVAARATATDLRPVQPRGPQRPAPWLVAAAALVLLAGTVWAVTGSGDDEMVVSDPASTPSASSTTSLAEAPAAMDLDGAQRACLEFAEEGFGGRDRLQVVGPNNAAHLRTADEVTTAVDRLDGAVGVLATALFEAGVRDPEVVGEAERIRRRLEIVGDQLAGGRLSPALAELGKVEELLIALDAALTKRGVPQCF